MTYKDRPPASARAARRSWDYFSDVKPAARRIEAMFYSPNCDGARAWIAELEVLENDSLHWGTSYDDRWRTLEASPYTIKRWANA